MPEDRGEIQRDQLSIKAAGPAENNVEPASRSASPGQLHDQALEGGMIALARVAFVASSQSDDETLSMDIDELLKSTPQMDSASGKYQAFETATDEPGLVPVERSKQPGSTLPSADIESLLQETRGPSAESPIESDTESSDQLGTTIGRELLNASAPRAISDPSRHVLDIAAAAAIVVLGSHVVRLKEDTAQVEPLPASSLIARQKTRRRQWPSDVWKLFEQFTSPLIR